MKKHIVVFLCLTAFNYSNANVAKWKQLFLQTARHAKASWKNHRELHAHKQALKKILACPIRKQVLLKELENLRIANNEVRKALEKADPRLKNRT